ncbi:patatin-like phospholipase family protein [Parvularcula lutaonensis]|uniref:Patatin-like phospholipase family protein n=1 Tax=Parvularcula lutaonensis TaxID=491923 RepID=A0ABV7M8S4_9PROT|nr:patatin-like phospholipase family protein [Parvularcula lutaonensis]GGY45279.1 patatin [Parvularcula lutaonensis]
MSENAATVGLVLSGGGARGAYQVGILKALAEALPGPLPFPVVTGVSVGAINAAVVAEGADDFQQGVARLERLWRSLSCAQVYRTDPAHLFGRLGRWGLAMAFSWAGAKAPQSLLDADPLKDLLYREIDSQRITRMVAEGHLRALAVTASSYVTGISTTFFQGTQPILPWNRARRKGERAIIGPQHIIASSALPGVFQARKVGDEWFGDGAIRQTAPLSPAIHLGCDRLFLIAARDGTPDDPANYMLGTHDYPTLGVLGGHLLDIVFNDNLDADQERLERINRTIEIMIPERRAQTNLRRIDTLMVRPSEDVRKIAGEHIDEIPRTVKTLLGAIGGLRAPYVLPSYLTFETGFIGALIDLGYKDAKNDIGRLLRFVRVGNV